MTITDDQLSEWERMQVFHSDGAQQAGWWLLHGPGAVRDLIAEVRQLRESFRRARAAVDEGDTNLAAAILDERIAEFSEDPNADQ